MNKSQEITLLQMVECILFKDYAPSYNHVAGLEKDFITLTGLVKTRGLAVFTLDLPNLDSILTDGLENGRLSLNGALSRRASKRILVPRLFRGMWLRCFDRYGCLLADPCIDTIFFLRQIFCLGKKIHIECSYDRYHGAIDEYQSIEDELREPTLRWDSLDLLHGFSGTYPRFNDDICLVDDDLFRSSTSNGKCTKDSLARLDYVCSLFSRAFGTPDPYRHSYDEESGRPKGLRHGPGAVADMQRRNVSKYSFPTWPAKLDWIFPFDAFGCVNADHMLEREYPSELEVPSKLIAVPKTAKAPRLIASEPTCNQWVQQLVASYFKQLFDSFNGKFVTLRDQTASQKMVHVASLDRNLCTIDLSSASDRLSCWIVERAFRSNIWMLYLLHSCRTAFSTIPLRGDSSYIIELRKFSTQGSALTFPLQSYIFLICALSLFPKEKSIEDYVRKYGNVVRVFGDDIIIPNTLYDEMTDLLSTLGLKVNPMKSFHKGYFRESCGMDCFKGYDVTPVKPKSVVPSSPTSIQSQIDLCNNLFKKGLWHTSAFVESTLPGFVRKALPIEGVEVVSRGLVSFCGTSWDHLKKRWNLPLQHHEALLFSTNEISERKEVSGYEGIFQFLREAPSDKMEPWRSGIPSNPKVVINLRWVNTDRSVT